MLYYVRYRLKDDKLSSLAEEVQSGGFPFKAKFVFASLEDPFVGLTIWDALNDDAFETIISRLKGFADVYEIIPVVSAEEAQQRIFKKLSEQ